MTTKEAQLTLAIHGAGTPPPQSNVYCFTCGLHLGTVSRKEMDRANERGYFTRGMRALFAPHALDPNAPQKCLTVLWVECPEQIALNPNTPPETLANLAHLHDSKSRVVANLKKNPAVALLTMGDDHRWARKLLGCDVGLTWPEALSSLEASP